MPRANDAVEAVLLEYADLLSILTEEPHRPRSYEKAARAVGGYPADITEFDVKQLRAIPNVGSSIAGKIHEFLQTGSIGALEELRAQIPQGVRALTAIPGLGPKRAMILYEQLGVASVDELLAAVNEGRLAEIKGFGKKTADNILRSIQQRGSSERRVLV
ncbi:MAG TPA: helix-hairpin-helix domain-containing protein, partial [Actinomycetota bacterium]|nr:helix-hairpin-helix domain-containing protein [Actinomycetota bacterium]